MRLREAAHLTALSERTIRSYVAEGLLWLRKVPPGHYEVTRDDVRRIQRIHRSRERNLSGWAPGLYRYLQVHRQHKLDDHTRPVWRL